MRPCFARARPLTALSALPRLELHFLPPYCPDHDAIERLWLDLLAQLTRNHPQRNLLPLCQDVARFNEVSHRLEVIEMLLDAGADPDHGHPGFASPLGMAMYSNRNLIAKRLIERGARLFEGALR